jgi:hypothetical protein
MVSNIGELFGRRLTGAVKGGRVINETGETLSYTKKPGKLELKPGI